jgi:hypothetical protein
MDTVKTLPEIPDEDTPPIRWAPWLTHRRLILFVIGWLVLFAVLSVFISNPFQSETSASATPDYARIMFLHGLLIGMVGLMSLLACQILRLRSTHVRLWITGGAIAATILAAVGGIWDRTIPGSEVPMWTQIFGFFALDEILLVLLVGIIGEWRTRSPAIRTLPYVGAALATASMLLAAIMGHLAGWIMEFGPNFPPLIGAYAKLAGFASSDDFVGALVGSHSHEMAVAVMAMIVILLAQQFGYGIHKGVIRVLTTTGLLLVAVGTVVMTAMYVAAAFTTWSPPAWFVSGPDGANGIASDDVITGILVMGGGVLVAGALVMGRSLFRQPVRLAAAWAWLLSFATVVVAGYAIELNTVYYGAGDPKAIGAANDAIFTWLHQDIGLFLLPAIVLVMLAVERLINRGQRRPGVIGWTAIAGTTITFVGGLVYVFVTPTLYGPGYILSTAGLVVVGIALLATLWWGVIGAIERVRHAPPAPAPSEPAPVEAERELVTV